MGWGGLTVIIMQVSVQIGLNWYWTGTELGKNEISCILQLRFTTIISMLWSSSKTSTTQTSPPTRTTLRGVAALSFTFCTPSFCVLASCVVDATASTGSRWSNYIVSIVPTMFHGAYLLIVGVLDVVRVPCLQEIVPAPPLAQAENSQDNRNQQCHL